MQYYDAQKNWRKIKPHLNDAELQRIMVEDFNKYTFGLWGKEFKAGMLPFDFESCDWWLSHRGRRPEFWKYVKHAASHWLVNRNLRLAMLVEPKRKWRILTSDQHSTVWDGKNLILDLNYQAFGVSAKESFEAACQYTFDPGQYMEISFAEHYTKQGNKKKDKAEPTAPQSNQDTPPIPRDRTA